MAQQTAVEWLFQEIDQVIDLNTSDLERVYKAVEQAKEMEKQQTIDAYCEGFCHSDSNQTEHAAIDGYLASIQYYNKKYKK
ncbi:MAG: hypothetical protein WCH59_09165 [Chitinophagia bacterium]